MALIQALRQRERGFCGKTKAAVGLFLQSGQVKQTFAAFAARLAFFGYGGGFSAYGVSHGLRFLQTPNAVFFLLFVFRVFFVQRVKPFGRVGACSCGEFGVDFPIVSANKFADLFFALHHHTQGRRLHTANGCQEETAFAGIKRG